MTEHKWIDRSQPQTLQSAVLLSYVIAASAVVGWAIFQAPPWFLMMLVLPVPAYFVANEKKAGYATGIALSFLLLFVQIYWLFNHYPGVVISMIFTVALIALYLHPHSRDYEKIWFR